MIYSVELVSGVQQSGAVIHKHIPIFSHIGYYKLLNRFPCALQWVLINHLLYNSEYTLFSQSQFFPPPNYFTYCNYKIDFEICLFLFFLNKLFLSLLLNSTYKWYHMMFVCLWLISLSMITSRSTHVAANGIISCFLWLSNIPLCICTTSLSIPLSMDTCIASTSWLLWLVLQWTLGCMCLLSKYKSG